MAVTDYMPWKLDPEFWDRLSRLQKQITDLTVFDGSRNTYQQQLLRDEAANKGFNPDDYFAKPGESAHNYGFGADVTGNLVDAHRKAANYGLVFPLKQDPWHIEPVHVTTDGLPYKAPPAALTFDYTDTTPVEDRGLAANIARQHEARTLAQRNQVPADVPLNMLSPELRQRAQPSNAQAQDQLAKQQQESVRSQQKAEQDAKKGKPLSGAQPEEAGGTLDKAVAGPVTTPAPAPAPTVGGTGQGDADLLNRTRLWNAAARGAGGAGIVNWAMSQIGKPYSTSGRFGPGAFDCSGLVVAALRANGVDPGGNTVSTSLQTWGRPIDLETAYNTPGAMLFVWGSGPAGHVEISRGDGTTIGSARGGVQVRPARGRGWTGAALPPGVNPGAAGGGLLPAGGPDRITPAEVKTDPAFLGANLADIFHRGGARNGGLQPQGAPLAGAGTTPQQGLEPALAPSPVGQPAEQPQQPTELPPGAPPPAAAPAGSSAVGKPGTPSPVAPGETLSAAQKQQGETVTIPAGASQEVTEGQVAKADFLDQNVVQQQAAPAPGEQPAAAGQQQAAAGGGDFYGRLLGGIGAPDTPENRRFLEAWQKAEGGSADNPFNTTQSAAGATVLPGNTAGVKRYPSIDVGLMATLQTLMNGKYENILAALRAGNSAHNAAQALVASPWGTGSLVLRMVG